MGRPREFDETDAIQQAMLLFWDEGFDGSSLEALEQATGLNRSSLYNTFGSKLELFVRALDAYAVGPCRDMLRPLREQRGGHALAAYLAGLRAFVRSPDGRLGCLMVNTSLQAPASHEVDHKVHDHFASLHSMFERAYRAGLRDCSVSGTMRPREAANWLQTFARGVLAGAVGGESGAVLDSSIRTAARQLGVDRL